MVFLGTVRTQQEGGMVVLETAGTQWGQVIVTLGTVWIQWECMMVALGTDRRDTAGIRDGDLGTVGMQYLSRGCHGCFGDSGAPARKCV